MQNLVERRNLVVSRRLNDRAARPFIETQQGFRDLAALFEIEAGGEHMNDGERLGNASRFAGEIARAQASLGCVQ